VRSVVQLAVVAVSLLLSLVLGGSASAQGEDERAEPRGWEYGLMFGFGVHSQGLDAAAISPDSLDFIREPPTTPGVKDTSSGTAPGDSATTPYLNLTARLYLPEDLLGEGYHVPRILFDLGADFPLDNSFRGGAYDFDFDTLDFTNPSQDPADFCPQEQPDPVDACSYAARTTVDILANWTVGVGLDFTLPVLEDRYHVIPSFGYFGQAYESDGTFSVTLSSNVASDDVRSIQASSDTEILHGLYAGLGLGVDVWEAMGMTSRLSLNGRAAYILTDRETTYSGTNPTPTPNFNTSDFIARPSSWVFSAFAGFEIRYDPSKR
jgi:hypothetical protein